jgi:hypothetical protein
MSEAATRIAVFSLPSDTATSIGEYKANSQTWPGDLRILRLSRTNDLLVGTAGVSSDRERSLAGPGQSTTLWMRQLWSAREIPSFRMREYKVVRLIPNRAAAPFGPMILPRVCCRVLQMCSRFKSSSVTGPSGELTCAPDVSLSRGQQRVLPEVSITLHSMKFCSSRMFPGHE